MSLKHHKSNSTATQSLSFDDVADFFSLPLDDAASTLGVSASVLKRICRENGLDRWPHRKFLSGKSIEEIKRHAARERRKEIAELSKVHWQSCQSQPQNNEQPKLQFGIAVPNVKQQGAKNMQTEQALNFSHQSLMIGTKMSDEFKFGFPSDGLSIATNKWWGSSKSDGHEAIDVDGAETEGEDKNQSIEEHDDTANDKPDENGKLQDNVSPQGSALLVAVRKRAVEEGQEALKLGVHRGRGMKMPSSRKASLLLRIFKSSSPSEWFHSPS
ncbi:Glucan synthase-like 7 [Hibiscus syriacus]|uniref:Glucan synthase-like 7 n=1 Tax=Hibiscus syriacus TaxID=106335 RepID=A0A6A2WD32_HIBSY|nr:protein NLP2-like [Hibiscus syriacus]KAE8655788.1 Glucan synthase-like 7 [Hibiscus syriacus]